MKPIQGWDKTQAKDGTSNKLPAGGYVCNIVSARETETKNGDAMLAILFDIAEGPHKDFFRHMFDNQRTSNPDTKWRGVYNQPLYDKEGQPNGWLKGLITTIEKCNPGFKWAWNEAELKGKKIGFVFREEEYLDTSGNLRTSTKPAWPRSVEEVRKGIEPPAIKKLNAGMTNNGFTQTNEFPASFAGDPPPVSDDDTLPF